MDKSTGFVQTALAATRDFEMYRSTHFDEGRPDSPQVWLRAGTCIDCISVMFVYYLLAVSWLSININSVRGVRRCGGRHDLGFRVGMLGLFGFTFLLLRFVQSK